MGSDNNLRLGVVAGRAVPNYNEGGRTWRSSIALTATHLTVSPPRFGEPLGAPMSLDWVHESPSVEGSALPKSVKSGKLSLNKVGIGRMSAYVVFPSKWLNPNTLRPS
jgi:hypothetical protein